MDNTLQKRKFKLFDKLPEDMKIIMFVFFYLNENWNSMFNIRLICKLSNESMRFINKEAFCRKTTQMISKEERRNCRVISEGNDASLSSSQIQIDQDNLRKYLMFLIFYSNKRDRTFKSFISISSSSDLFRHTIPRILNDTPSFLVHFTQPIKFGNPLLSKTSLFLHKMKMKVGGFIFNNKDWYNDLLINLDITLIPMRVRKFYLIFLKIIMSFGLSSNKRSFALETIQEKMENNCSTEKEHNVIRSLSNVWIINASKMIEYENRMIADYQSRLKQTERGKRVEQDQLLYKATSVVIGEIMNIVCCYIDCSQYEMLFRTCIPLIDSFNIEEFLNAQEFPKPDSLDRLITLCCMITESEECFSWLINYISQSSQSHDRFLQLSGFMRLCIRSPITQNFTLEMRSFSSKFYKQIIQNDLLSVKISYIFSNNS